MMDEQDLDRQTRVPKHIRRKRDDTDMLMRALEVAEQYKAKLETATKELAKVKAENLKLHDALDVARDHLAGATGY